jgi:Fe-S oxidoreductase
MGFAVHTPITVCCGLPALSKGMVDDTRKKIRQNLDMWGPLVSRVDFVVTTCSSCGLSLTREWADVLADPLVSAIRSKCISVSGLVLRFAGRLAGDLHHVFRSEVPRTAYHAPCHLRIQGDPDASVRMLTHVAGAGVVKLNSHCCGMAGTWGAMTDHVDLSLRIGSDLAERVRASGACQIVTECPTCALQMEQVTGLPVVHPMQIMAELIPGV